MNALYDILNHTYLDAIVEPKTKYNEQRAAGAMRKSSAPKKAILLADRGYGGFNFFETLHRNGTDYLRLVKNDFCREIVVLPMKDFDTVIHIEIWTTQTNLDKADCGRCPNIHYFPAFPNTGKIRSVQPGATGVPAR